VRGEGDDERPLIQTSAAETSPRISPDGRYLVYMSNESGSNQVYLTTFPEGRGKWQVSTDGGVWPRWSRDGTEIFYRQRAGGAATMISVRFESSPELRLGSPRELFSAESNPDLAFGNGYSAFTPTSDSDRFIMLRHAGVEAEESTRLVFVENWLESWKDQID
jgi:hypothetical protein